jgi:hypothetical protein
MKHVVAIGAVLLAVLPAAAQDFLMSPTVKGVYACEGPDIGNAPKMFGLIEGGAFNLADGPGDFLMYDGVSGVLQLAKQGRFAVRLARTGPEEYRLLGAGDQATGTLCRLVPGKNPDAPPW